MDLNIVWFFLIGVLLVGYAILDGFDLGVGALHLFSRGDAERRIFMNAIGPVWDGNEVWLVTAGGALFAAFPHAYATAFSALYVPLMLVLAALIFRAVALEFRSKEPMAWWRRMWDIGFSASSILASVLFGAAVGNLIVGLPIDQSKTYTGTFLGLLGWYQLSVGVLTLSLFAMHGAIYLYLKTEGELQEKVRGWITPLFWIFVVVHALVTAATLAVHPQMLANFREYWWVWGVAILEAGAIANIPRALHLGLPFRAFVSSCCVIAAMIFIFGMGMFPNLIVSAPDPSHSLTVYGAASSPRTLGIMLVIAIMGLPFVLSYTAAIYWVFRGKVRVDKFSY